MEQIEQKISQNHLPQDHKSQIEWLRLVRSRRVGPATFVRLLSEYSSVKEALDSLPNIARNAGITGYTPCSYHLAEQELNAGLEYGFTPLFLGANTYPKLLAQAPDAPTFLWAKGNITLVNRPCIALVGARNSSSLGRRMTRAIAKELGEAHFSIVSGLARGIDTAAHQASLEFGTISIQAGGLDVIYPKENESLSHEIDVHGLRLSEQPIGIIPQARHFPQRNRIIAGLSLAVVVIEGAARSGSLITARCAADLSRDVMAVPGHPLDGRATGCNILIRDGATLVRSAKDIIEALQRPETEKQETIVNKSQPDPIPSQITNKILNLLGPTSVSEDDIIRDSGLSARTVSRYLTTLELNGQIIRQPGGMLAKVA